MNFGSAEIFCVFFAESSLRLFGFWLFWLIIVE